MSAKFESLKSILGEIHDVNSARALLEWDQQTYMPENSAAGRACQISTLSCISHEKATSKELGNLIGTLEKEFADAPPDSFEKCLLRRVRRDFEKNVKVPSRLVAETSECAAKAHHAWEKAREASDFSIFAPLLSKLIELRREYAQIFNPYKHIYDPLMDDFEEGLTVAEVDQVFGGLRDRQVSLIKEICSRQTGHEADCLQNTFPEAEQIAFTLEIIRKMGYDMTRGRQDIAAHPFTTSFGLDDVRITTRTFAELPLSSVFSSIHECGHALYELGIDKSLDRTPLAEGASLALHESQSRLWENIVGRSREFWTFFYPLMQKHFPSQLGNVSLETFFKAVNVVKPSMIRVEADEVTYNLHIMLRYEIEKDLMSGRIECAALPGIWNSKMKDYLGIEPENDAEGVLQDVHWSMGAFGYFPTYALGNLMAAQIWESALAAHPEIPSMISRGEFGTLLGFLRRNLHSSGAKFTPSETLRLATGSAFPDPEFFLRFLAKKYLS